MKIKSLKNIVPLQYNGFYSIHNSKTIAKERINNLPLINTFSRNFNKNFNKMPNLFNTQSSYNKTNELFSNKNQEFDNNLKKIPYSSFLHLSNYLKSKHFKNKTKINNHLSPSNKVNEVYFNINKTEYNQFNTKKCFSIEAINNLKKKSQIRLIKNKNSKSSIDEILEKEKEEFRKTMNAHNRKKKIIDKCSFIIYQHFFPYNRNNHINYSISEQMSKNNLKIKKIDKKNASTSTEADFIKNNTFFEIIIEKVMHLVEYKNHMNKVISINIVKNLLNEEINSMYNKLTNKNNCSKITYESIKINKSTSTDDNYYSDYKLLNNIYDKYDDYSNTSISGIDIEKKARKKLEKRLSILNDKYGFESKDNEINVNFDLFSNYSFNIDNYSQRETDNIIKSKKNIYSEEDDDNYGDYIISIANNINDNLEDYKNSLNYNKSIFKTSNMKDLLSQFLTGKTNQGRRKSVYNFNFQIKDKKNIDFDDFKNNIIELYQNYLLMKEGLKENKKTQTNNTMNYHLNSQDNPNSNSISSIIPKNPNLLFKPKLVSNMIFDDFLDVINKDEEFSDFMNTFGGYYSFGEKKNIKEILKKMKEESVKTKFKYNPSKNKTKRNLNSFGGLFTSTKKGFLGKASEEAAKEKSKNSNNSNIKKNNKNINNSLLDSKFNNDKAQLNSNSFNDEEKGEEKEKDIKIEHVENSINKEENKIDIDIKENKPKEKNEKKNRNIKVSRRSSIEKKSEVDTLDYSNNKNLNEFEREFFKQTNNLNDLNQKDKEQILKYLKEIDSLIEKEINGSINIYSRIRINNIHYLIEKYIVDLLKKGLFNLKSKEKVSKDILKLLKNSNFHERQRRQLEGEEEEENDSKNSFHLIDSNDNEVDIDSIFKKWKGRSRSTDIKKLRIYYKIYHKLLFKKIKHRKNLLKVYSANKKMKTGDWRSIIKKKARKKKKKKDLFHKKKKKIYDLRYSTRSLMTNDLEKLEPPLIHDYIEDEEIRQFQEEEKRKKLRQELIERKMNDFFKKIQKLKKGGMKNFEKELEILVDEQLDRIDYSKEKENEFRRNNFVQDFDLSRTKDFLTKQFKSKKMHYLSPIIFFTGNKNNINDNK